MMPAKQLMPLFQYSIGCEYMYSLGKSTRDPSNEQKFVAQQLMLYKYWSILPWVKVQNFENPEIRNSELKTCIMHYA